MKQRTILIFLFLLCCTLSFAQSGKGNIFRLEERAAFRLMGKCIRDTRDPGTLLMTWMDFYKTQSDVPVFETNVQYGLYAYEDKQPPTTNKGLLYMASFEVENPKSSSEVFTAATIPAAQYAIFEHHGPVSTVYSTISSIFNKWLPQNKLKPAKNFYFERFDKRYKVEDQDSVIELWVPVKSL